MKFILILLSMMFALSVSAISVDNDVGGIDALRVVYVVPDKVISPVETVNVVPEWLFANENYKQALNKGRAPIDGVDVGSINRFVILNSAKVNYKPESYQGYSLDCVNKLI